MEQWEEADQAAGPVGSTGDTNISHDYDLLAIAASTSTAVFDESACSSDNDEDVTSDVEDVPVKKRETSATSSNDEGGISTSTNDLIQRSFSDNNRRRQKLEQKRTSFSHPALDKSSDILRQDEQIIESEKLDVPFVAQQPVQESNESTGVLDNGKVKDDYQDYVAPLITSATAAPTLMPVNVPEEPPPLSTPTQNTTIPPTALLGSNPSSSFVADSTINSNDRRNSFSSQFSLDLRAVFISRRSIPTDDKQQQVANGHDSLSFSNFSQTMATVFSAENDEACCRGRREWIIFVCIIVASVILFAAFLDTGGGTGTAALGRVLPPSGAPSQMPSIVPTAIPTTTAPSRIPSTIPTKAPTITPSTLPLSLLPSTSEPFMVPSLNRESKAPAVVISELTPPITVPVAIPWPQQPSASPSAGIVIPEALSPERVPPVAIPWPQRPGASPVISEAPSSAPITVPVAIPLTRPQRRRRRPTSGYMR